MPRTHHDFKQDLVFNSIVEEEHLPTPLTNSGLLPLHKITEQQIASELRFRLRYVGLDPVQYFFQEQGLPPAECKFCSFPQIQVTLCGQKSLCLQKHWTESNPCCWKVVDTYEGFLALGGQHKWVLGGEKERLNMVSAVNTHLTLASTMYSCHKMS